MVTLPCCITFVVAVGVVCVCFVLGVFKFRKQVALRAMIRVTMVTVRGQTHRMVTLCNAAIDTEL